MNLFSKKQGIPKSLKVVTLGVLFLSIPFTRAYFFILPNIDATNNKLFQDRDIKIHLTQMFLLEKEMLNSFSRKPEFFSNTPSPEMSALLKNIDEAKKALSSDKEISQQLTKHQDLIENNYRRVRSIGYNAWMVFHESNGYLNSEALPSHKLNNKLKTIFKNIRLALDQIKLSSIEIMKQIDKIQAKDEIKAKAAILSFKQNVALAIILILLYLGVVSFILAKERKEKDKVVLENLDTINSIFESLPQIIFIINKSGQITFTNSYALSILGYSKNELAALNFTYIAEENEKKYIVAQLINRIENEEMNDEHIILNSKYNFKIPVLLNAKKIESKNKDQDSTFLLLATDERKSRLLNELKSKQSQLIQAAKLSSLGTMAAGVAHELNNPLAGVKGFTEILLTKTQDEKTKKILNKILHSSTRMQEIINHLRTFSRESKKEDWHNINPIEPALLAIDLLHKQLSIRGITIVVKPNDSLIQVNGNPNQLESVFQNLITNSRDAFDDITDSRQKTIQISTEVDEIETTITYQDNAGGIPENIIRNIFDPFFTTKDTNKGTGLGMSISQGIIEDHKGTITVESTPGEGSTFTVKMPNAKENSQISAA